MIYENYRFNPKSPASQNPLPTDNLPKGMEYKIDLWKKYGEVLEQRFNKAKSERDAVLPNGKPKYSATVQKAFDLNREGDFIQKYGDFRKWYFEKIGEKYKKNDTKTLADLARLDYNNWVSGKNSLLGNQVKAMVPEETAETPAEEKNGIEVPVKPLIDRGFFTFPMEDYYAAPYIEILWAGYRKAAPQRFAEYGSGMEPTEFFRTDFKAWYNRVYLASKYGEVNRSARMEDFEKFKPWYRTELARAQKPKSMEPNYHKPDVTIKPEGNSNKGLLDAFNRLFATNGFPDWKDLLVECVWPDGARKYYKVGRVSSHDVDFCNLFTGLAGTEVGNKRVESGGEDEEEDYIEFNPDNSIFTMVHTPEGWVKAIKNKGPFDIAVFFDPYYNHYMKWAYINSKNPKNSVFYYIETAKKEAVKETKSKKNTKKNVIRLTESQLRQVIRESVKRVLREG